MLRECTFGRTPCLVEATRERVGGGPLWLATLYVREQDGRARRHVGDRAGLRVRIPAGDERTAVTNGTRYLEKRFGWHGVSSWSPARCVSAGSRRRRTTRARRRSRWSTCRPLLAHRAESAHQRPVPPAARWDVARLLSVSSVIHERPSTPRSSFWTVRRHQRSLVVLVIPPAVRYVASLRCETDDDERKARTDYPIRD